LYEAATTSVSIIVNICRPFDIYKNFRVAT